MFVCHVQFIFFCHSQRRIVKRAAAAEAASESKPESSATDAAASAENRSAADDKSDTDVAKADSTVDEKAELMPSSESSDSSLSEARKRTVAE
jgi:hypothetical protein